jgi:hypothetical protein
MASRRWTGALLTILVLAGPSLAEEVRGVITRVDLARKKVVVEGRGRGVRGVALTFTLARDCQIMFGRETGTPDDLEAGRRVRVRFETDNGEKVASLLRVRGRLPDRNDGKTVTGTLKRLDREKAEIVVSVRVGKRTPAREVTLTLADKIAVTRGGKTIPLEQLKEGARIRVHRESRKGTMVAQSIQVVGIQWGDLITQLRGILDLADMARKLMK